MEETHAFPHSHLSFNGQLQWIHYFKLNFNFAHRGEIKIPSDTKLYTRANRKLVAPPWRFGHWMKQKILFIAKWREKTELVGKERK